MAKGTGSNSEMARARQSDGLSVIFDQKSPASSRSRSHSTSRSRSRSKSRSRYDGSRSSGSYRGRDRRRRYNRSSSSSSPSSRSRSSSRPRSRSYPRCHRRSPRCRCDDHRTYSRGYSRRSPPRHYRAHSRSYSRSPDRYSGHRRYRSASRSRSRSRSPIRWSRYRGRMTQYRCRFSRSPSRSRSRSRSTGRSVSLSMRDKRVLLKAAKANAMKILGVEKLELPESVKPILSDPEPEKRVRQGSQKTESQGTEDEPGDASSPKTSLKGKIAFSINNSVAKPTAAAPPAAKVTSRVDSVASRKPYGQWIPVRSVQSSRARKRT